MQFLKILFWCLLAFVAAIFTIGNWTTVPIHLWAGLIADVNLPLLLFVTFLAGLVPTMIYYSTIRWRLRNQLSTSERAMSDLRTTLTLPAAPLTPDAEPGALAVVAPPPADAPPASPASPSLL
jgi:putative membrane protein